MEGGRKVSGQTRYQTHRPLALESDPLPTALPSLASGRLLMERKNHSVYMQVTLMKDDTYKTRNITQKKHLLASIKLTHPCTIQQHRNCNCLYLSSDVTVIQWITSCHKNHMTTCNKTLACRCNIIDDVHVNNVFSYWNSLYWRQ